jgi:hypothetical protein
MSKHSIFFQLRRGTLTGSLKVLSGVGGYVSRKPDELRRLSIERGALSQDGIHRFDAFLPRVRVTIYYRIFIALLNVHV